MYKPFLVKFNRFSVALLIIGVGIGILVTAQWRTLPTRVSDSVVPYVTLQETRDNLVAEQDNYKKSIKDYQDKINDEQQKLKTYSANKTQVEELEKDQKTLGLTEAKGDGVIITLDDSKSELLTDSAITHAADLRDLVNFLFRFGATAISINGERIVFYTSIDCIVNTILINSTKTTPPFTVKAISDGAKIIEELNKEENLTDIHKRVKEEGLILSAKQENNIEVPAYTGSMNTKYVESVN